MSGVIRSLNPFDPSDVVAEAPAASAEQIDASLTALASAQPGWQADSMLRLRSLTALAGEIETRHRQFTDLMVREVGKPVPEAAGEVDRDGGASSPNTSRFIRPTRSP